ncbi:TRAP transporter small permease subunit [Litoricolaceae bacterium]|nr:TRAP transporter small permease subunit [Litorivicinaceae bacterium]
MIVKLRYWSNRFVNFLLALTLATIFVTFLSQIFARYAPKLGAFIPVDSVALWLDSVEPIGWTVNLISLLWVWLVFLGCAFVVRERDHVVFDVFTQAMSPRWSLICKIVVALTVLSAMVWSFVPVWEAIFGSRLMDLKKIQTLRIPITGDKIAIKWLFAPYVILMVALVVRYIFVLVQALGLDRKFHKDHNKLKADI